MASYLPARLFRALALSSLVRGPAGARDDPAIGWRRLASASLRLGVGRPLAASAGERGLDSAGPSGLCVPGESWAVPSVAPALRRRNTAIAYRGEPAELNQTEASATPGRGADVVARNAGDRVGWNRLVARARPPSSRVSGPTNSAGRVAWWRRRC